MDKSKIERKLNGYIYIPAEGEREFFLIHGYTGSTHDFSNLPQILNESFDAGVNRILLPGHEKDVDALLDLTLNDFIDYTEKIFVERMMAGKKIILVGISFGAQLAMYLASKYEVAGIVIISMAHKFKWPLNIPGTALLAMTRKKWKKRLSVSENELRKDSCCYSYMPSAGFFMTKKFAKMIEGSAKNVNAPILSVYSTSERLANYKAIDNLYKKLSSIKKEKYLVSNEFHSLFYSPHKEEIIHKIISFVKDNSLFENVHSCQINADEKVTAIVPSYNEATRIGKVLEVLEQVNFIEEIIVVDDASSDDTESVVTRFKKVKYVKNERNMGKAYGMDRGVKMAKNDIVFFCDADLIGFKPEYAKEIISPVLEGRFDMFIGLRNNFMQRTVKKWALNSGERTMRKVIWNNLPEYYKYRYRVEAGLNYYVSKYTRKGMGWKTFEYSQPIKESKYGLIKGTFLRWWMNLDVFSSYVAYPFVKKNGN